MSVEGGEDLRCDREGYFDLESLKPYSSVWVSTRRDARSKTNQQDDDNDNKKNVMPSRACNNLHSLLETLEGSPSEEEIRKQVQQLTSTKSDHFPLNSYKLFEKADSVSLKKISDKIIESMCKNDAKPVFNDNESAHLCTQNMRIIVSRESVKMPQDRDTQEEQQNAETSEDESEGIQCGTVNKLQKINDEEPLKVKIAREPSRSSHLGGGEPQEEKSTKCKLLSDNGKLVTEMSLTALKLKDQAGREFPVTVKYIWETDFNEIINSSDNVFNSSPAFVKITESISAVGMKCDGSYLTNTPVHSGKLQTWQERSKSQSSCVQARNVKKIEGWNTDDKEAESNHNVHGSKGDAPNVRKALFKEAQSTRNAHIRPKVSMIAPYNDKKLFDNIHDSRHTDGQRESSKINASERKALAERKNRIPVKKKFPAVGELKGPNTMTRPATFNKREPAPRPALNRPPSAPTREMTSRIPQRIAVQESGDKLPQSFNKRPFGTKFQAPTPTSSANKFWK